MIDKTVTDFISSQYAIWQAENQMGANPEDGFYIQLYGDKKNVEASSIVRDYLKEHKEIEGAGYVRYSSLQLSQLGNDKLLEGKDSEHMNCRLIACDKNVISLGNLKLSSEHLDIINSASKDCEPVFLGCYYKDKVEPGTVLTIENGRLSSQVYVAGFLEKDAAWPHENGLFGASSGPTDRYSLNEGILLITDDITKYYQMDSYMIYGVAKTGCYEHIKADVARFAVEKGINIKIVNYGEEIEAKKDNNNIVAEDAFIAAIMLTILAVVSMSAVSIIYCLVNKKQYGIMLANGLSRSDIIWLITMQNVITIIISGVSAWLIRQNEIFNDKSMDKNELINSFETIYKQLHIAHDYYIPIILLLVGILIVAISIIIPIYIIRKSSLSELLSSSGASGST